jgi:glycerol-3-phosphate dehydrogenase
VVARDAETGALRRILANVVVNATGIFSDTLRWLDQPDALPMTSPSQGIHLVLDASFQPGPNAIMVPQTDDGRVLFLIPWHGRVPSAPLTRRWRAPRSTRARPRTNSAAQRGPLPAATAATCLVFAPAPLVRRRQRHQKISREHAVVVSNSAS